MWFGWESRCVGVRPVVLGLIAGINVVCIMRVSWSHLDYRGLHGDHSWLENALLVTVSLGGSHGIWRLTTGRHSVVTAVTVNR